MARGSGDEAISLPLSRKEAAGQLGGEVKGREISRAMTRWRPTGEDTPQHISRDRYRVKWGKEKRDRDGDRVLEGEVQGALKNGQVVSRGTRYPVFITGPFIAKNGKTRFTLYAKNPYIRDALENKIARINFSSQEDAIAYAESELVDKINQIENGVVHSSEMTKVAKRELDELEKQGIQTNKITFAVSPEEGRDATEYRLSEIFSEIEGINDNHQDSHGRLFGWRGGRYYPAKYYEIGGFEVKELENGYKLLSWSVHQADDGFAAQGVAAGNWWVSFNSEHSVMLDPKGKPVRRWTDSVAKTSREARGQVRTNVERSAREYSSHL